MFVYMACTSKLHFLVFLLLLLPNYGVHGVRRMPCYFIFGDSLADNGNNNVLNTTAKVNYPPYGIDFPSGPTGRFTNGRTAVDIIAQLLGFGKFIPPFATAKGNEILEGVNYASGGSGIRDETGQILGEHICLNAQLKNHGTTISRMTEILGNQNQTTDLLNKCLYTLEIGSNDFINNYFMPQFYDTSKIYTAEQYARILISQYSQQLTTLYNYGARKISLFGVGSVGCTPFAINSFGTNGSLCVDKMNVAVQIFNDKLKLLVDQLNSKLTDARFIFIDILRMSTNIIKSIPVVRGANGPSTTALCCQVNQFGVCTPLTKPCPNRSSSLFWDAFHPTEAANLLTAVWSYSAVNPSDVHPMDINGLTQL